MCGYLDYWTGTYVRDTQFSINYLAHQYQLGTCVRSERGEKVPNDL